MEPILPASTVRYCVDLGDPLIVFSFGRSGTHMLIDLIRRQFPAFRAWKWPGEPNGHVYGLLDDLAGGERVAERTIARLKRSTRPLIMTHRLPETEGEVRRQQPQIAAWLDRGKLIHIVRHPCHAMNSAWPVECGRAASGLQPALSPLDYVRWSAERWTAQLDAMIDRPHERLRFEDLRTDPEGGVRLIETLTGERALWRKPLLPSPHASVAAARLCRAVSFHPWSTNCVSRAPWLKRFRLAWTAEMSDALSGIAGEHMTALGYDPLTPKARPAARQAKVSLGQLAASRP